MIQKRPLTPQQLPRDLTSCQVLTLPLHIGTQECLLCRDMLYRFIVLKYSLISMYISVVGGCVFFL